MNESDALPEYNANSYRSGVPLSPAVEPCLRSGRAHAGIRNFGDAELGVVEIYWIMRDWGLLYAWPTGKENLYERHQ